jgi:hypothetical protein
MHNGDTIQKLISTVDTIQERATDNAVKKVFAKHQAGNSDHDRASYVEGTLVRISMERD